MNFTFPKDSRLCSKILIDKVFLQGNKLYNHPIKVLWLVTDIPEKTALQCLISVSKKRFKRANKRNLLKRRIREAFRLNHQALSAFLAVHNIQLAVLILYNANELHKYDVIENKLVSLFNEIIIKIEKSLKA